MRGDTELWLSAVPYHVTSTSQSTFMTFVSCGLVAVGGPLKAGSLEELRGLILGKHWGKRVCHCVSHC